MAQIENYDLQNRIENDRLRRRLNWTGAHDIRCAVLGCAWCSTYAQKIKLEPNNKDHWDRNLYWGPEDIFCSKYNVKTCTWNMKEKCWEWIYQIPKSSVDLIVEDPSIFRDLFDGLLYAENGDRLSIQIESKDNLQFEKVFFKDFLIFEQLPVPPEFQKWKGFYARMLYPKGYLSTEEEFEMNSLDGWRDSIQMLMKIWQRWDEQQPKEKTTE